MDWFGDKVDFRVGGDQIFAKMRVNENAVIYWALQYGEYVEIVSPISTREKIKSRIDLLKKKYE